LNTTDLKVLRR